MTLIYDYAKILKTVVYHRLTLVKGGNYQVTRVLSHLKVRVAWVSSYTYNHIHISYNNLFFCMHGKHQTLKTHIRFKFELTKKKKNLYQPEHKKKSQK